MLLTQNHRPGLVVGGWLFLPSTDGLAQRKAGHVQRSCCVKLQGTECRVMVWFPQNIVSSCRIPYAGNTLTELLPYTTSHISEDPQSLNP